MNLRLQKIKKIILNKEFLTVFLIFILALAIRTIYLSSIPFRFHNDEVISGYIGRFILLNGKDVYGNSWPLFFFNYFGDFRVILPMYINGLSTFIFGVNVFAVRFPSALIGSLIIFPIYSISKILLGKRKIVYFAPFLIAILPWHIVLSRATSEGIAGLTVFTFGLLFLIKSIQERKIKFLLLSCIALALTYFLYPTFRLLSPLALLPIPFLLTKDNNRKAYFAAIIFFFLLTFLVSTTNWGSGRFLQTSLFSSKDIATQVKAKEVALGDAEINVHMANIFDNKIVGYTQQFVSNYSDYFSPVFLFIKGGLPDRYVIPDVGLLFISFTIFLLGLLVPASTKLNRKFYLYILFLLLLAPLPAALTVDDIPNMHRSLFMIVPIVLLSTIGICKIVDLLVEKKQRIILFGFCVLIISSLLIEFTYFVHQYSVQEPSYKSFSKEDGFKEVALDIKQYEKENKNIVMPLYGALPIYYLFFTNNFDKNLAGTFQTGLIVKKIKNVTFSENSCPADENLRKTISLNTVVIEDGDCEIKGNFKEITSVFRRDATKAFKILEPIRN